MIAAEPPDPKAPPVTGASAGPIAAPASRAQEPGRAQTGGVGAQEPGRAQPGGVGVRGAGLPAPDAVVLEGQQLRLRPLLLADLDALLALRVANRAFLAPFEPRRPSSFFTADGQRDELARAALDWESGRQYAFGLFLRSSSQLVGRIAISGIARGPFESAHLGYFVDERHCGRGLATEAVRLTVRFAFGPASLGQLQAAVMSRNQPSKRVLEKAGFRRQGIARRYLCIDGVWEDHEIYALTREDHEDHP